MPLIVGANPAALVKVPADRPLPIVWEDERVQRWKTTGEIPALLDVTPKETT